MDDLTEIQSEFSRFVESQDNFSAEIKVNPHIKFADANKSVDYSAGPTRIYYEIIPEYRSWGIKDITVMLKDFSVDVEIEEETDENDVVIAPSQSFTVKVPAENVKIDWRAGSGFFPGQLDLSLLDDGKLVSAELEFFYYSPDA